MSTRRQVAALGVGALTTVFALGGPPAAEAQNGPNAKDVVVTNTPANPVPVRNVDERPRQPFQRPFIVDLTAAEDFGETTYTVPANKRWVIEYGSMRASLAPDQTVFVNVVTTVGGQSAFHPMIVSDQGMYGALQLLGGAQQVRIYADPGTVVRVQFAREPSGGALGSVNSFMTLSGYQVDVP